MRQNKSIQIIIAILFVSKQGVPSKNEIVSRVSASTGLGYVRGKAAEKDI